MWEIPDSALAPLVFSRDFQKNMVPPKKNNLFEKLFF